MHSFSRFARPVLCLAVVHILVFPIWFVARARWSCFVFWECTEPICGSGVVFSCIVGSGGERRSVFTRSSCI